MDRQFSYSSYLFDVFGVLCSFNMAEDMWRSYQQFALPKVEEATLTLKGVLYNITNYTPDQASEELKSMDQLIPTLLGFRSKIEAIQEPEFQEFKTAVLEFIDTVELLHDALEEISQNYQPYQMSMPVLKEDWDSEADNHWDNY